MNDNAKHFDRFIRDYQALRKKLPRLFGIEAVNLFKANFDAEGFIAGEGRLQKWKPTIQITGRKILTKTRRLRRGIKIMSTSRSQVVVGVDRNIKYAKIHNDGGKIPVTPKMRRYFWAMFKETGKPMWKAMALTDKKEFVIPARPYIGDTLAMKPRLDRRTIKELKKITQKY